MVVEITGLLKFRSAQRARMRLLLIAFACVLPLLWGWTVHWLMTRFWPEAKTARGSEAWRKPSGDVPFDYQI